MKRERLLLIDVLRIIGIVLIILHHLSETRFSYGDYQRFTTFLLFPTYYINYGTIGILVFIFASGCSLAASGKSPSSISEVKDFYKNRLLRIYPVYWVAVFFSMFLRASAISTLTASDFLRTFFGFQEFFASSWEDEWGKINGAFWFIGNTPTCLCCLRLWWKLPAECCFGTLFPKLLMGGTGFPRAESSNSVLAFM
jgi:peptidoglycan/LPS O-acetylase OafA/YrhL